MLIQDLLERSVQLFPHRTAVDDGERRWSFTQLRDQVCNLAAALTRAGVEAEDRVALLSRNRAEYVALYFAAARLGAVLVPLNWRLTPPELATILGDAGPELVLAEAELAPRLEGCAHVVLGQLLGEGPDAPADPRDGRGRRAASWQPKEPSSDAAVAVQMYTSGTSGRPKGAMLTHRNCHSMTSAWLLDMPLDAGDRFLQVTPLFHVGGLLMLLSCVASGATLRLLPEFDPVAAIDVLSGEPTTHTLMVPAMLEWLLAEPYLVGKQLAHLRLVVYGAAPIPPATLERARARLACDFLQGYGLTESTGVLLTLTPRDHREGDAVRLASAGRAAPGCLVRVVDRNGEEVEASEDGQPGEAGEIVARGDNLSPGYWNDPDGTAAAWTDGWFHTGDLARIDTAGYITIVDRIKDMILVGGENVYPREVELVLLEHPDVRDAAVVGIPHDVWGEEVLALVVLEPGRTQTDRSLTSHCRGALARYKCPTRFQFPGELPRNAAGKLMKNELRAPHWQGRPRLV
ncbi:MAG: long-chain-fatty-acid--CoA ligase [Planctomycetota bacterium]|nr:long-chain-fatty-acid--CoA ligase [Planctomycetota bacterium]